MSVVDLTAEIRMRMNTMAGIDGKGGVLQDVIDKVLDAHPRFGIYDECGHDHDGEDEGVQYISEIGSFVCDVGLMYYICRTCCTEGPDDTERYQAERCATETDEGHEHTMDGHCPNVVGVIADALGVAS